MKEVLMMKGARTLVDICAAAKFGEKVLIVTDPERLRVAKLMLAAFTEKGIEPVTAMMFPNRFDGEEPPELIAEIMRRAELVITLVTKSISHTSAVKASLKEGARVLAMTGFTEEDMYLGGINADFRKQRAECDRFAKLFSESETVQITTPAGTDFSAHIGGRQGNSHPSIVDRPGQFSAAVDIEANVSPVEGESEGILIIDGSVPQFREIGRVNSPIRLEVKKGVVTRISGDKEAKFLQWILREIGDPLAFNVAQIAIGLNPESRVFTGLGVNDHGVYGTVHVGFGTSHNLGGSVKASIHFDGMMAEPTVSFDGKEVIQNGEVLKGAL